jgi:hypothetical protein
MTFDDQLKRAVDTLGDRLRDDINRALRLLTDDLSASAQADRETAAVLAVQAANEAGEAASGARAAAEAHAAADVAADARAAAEAQAVDEAAEARAAAEAAEAQAAAAATEAQAAAAATEARTAAEAAQALAAAEAAKAHVAAEAAEIHAAQTANPGRTETDALAPDDFGDEDRLGNLIRAVRSIDEARSLSEILETLVASAGEEAARAGVLLVHSGRVRGWRFVGFPPSFSGSAIDLPLDQTGIIARAVEHQRVASSVSDGPAPLFAALDEPDSTEAMAIPIALAGEVVAVLYVDQPDPEPGTLGLEPATLEVLARHAARALEALTAFKAARSISREDAGSSSAGNNVSVSSNGGSGGLKSDDENEAARRYARLVISEIKLYHEDAVAEGRRDRDLATRLGGEIARARALYDERVPAHLREAAEHFHAELVRTLGGGDATLFAKASLS